MNGTTDSTTTGAVVVTGANGLIGKTMLKLLGGSNLALTRNQLDFTRPEEIQTSLDHLTNHLQVRAVINCAAYTRVDQAEQEQTLAMTINGDAPGELAAWCAVRDIPLVHFSSDYVFSGAGVRPWVEDDPVAPINIYGQSKAKGDHNISKRGKNWLIFRPTWVYGENGKSFYTSMLMKAKEQEVLRVVSDQVGAPTYAVPLCQAVLRGLDRACSMKVFPSGVYHLCHNGETNWYAFCCEIIAAARRNGMALAVKQIIPVTSESFKAPAHRPLNSRLNTDKAYQVLGIRLPDWKVGFEACVQDTLLVTGER